MTSLRCLVPEETSNYVLNPALRYNANGWTASGSTISRVSTRARFGFFSLKVVTNGTALREGVFYRVLGLSGISDNITVSAYVRGSGKVRIRLIDNPRGKEWASVAITLTDNFWQRISVSGLSTGSDDMRLYVETDNNKIGATTFYVDGAQMERKPYPTTYCDGDQAGCRWNLVEHNSISSRSALTKLGGRWVDLAGTCRPNDNIYVTVFGGMGMAPIKNSIQDWATAPGGYFQNAKIQNRVVTLSFYTKNESRGIFPTKSISALHELRQQLIDIFKPDLTKNNDPIVFEYSDGDKPLYVKMIYEAGLEGEWDIRNRWTNSFPIRMIAVEPMLYEDSKDVQTLTFQKVFPGGVRCDSFGRINGEWSEMGSSTVPGANDNVKCVAIGKYGEVYIGGDFTGVDGVTGTSHIAYWDGTKWNQMAGGVNSSVNAIAVASNGDVYATGLFTVAGGGACARIAKWNGTFWSALGSGLNNTGYALCFGPSGELYVGGDFTTAGGVSVSRFARWMNNGWAKVGNSNLSSTVYAIVNAGDGLNMYLGGAFVFPPNFGSVVKFTIATNAFSDLYKAPVSDVRALAVSRAGILYAGGTFFQLSVGGVSALHLAFWTGETWSQLGDGADSNVYALDIDAQDNLYVGGQFSAFGSLSAKHLGMWNGTNFVNLDFIDNYYTASATNYVLGLACHPNGDLYIGYFDWGSAHYAAAINTVINHGTAEAYPTVFISGPGTLRYIENQTTNKKVYFRLPIVSGEEITIDFSAKKIVSSINGEIPYRLLAGSSFGDFSLAPGNNTLAVLMTDDVATSISILYTPTHWSADAVTKANSL